MGKGLQKPKDAKLLGIATTTSSFFLMQPKGISWP